jgi:predicted oxidoreductase
MTMPGTDIVAPNVVLGMMRTWEMSNEGIRALVGAAMDSGITFFDHAAVYGGEFHGCERRFGEAMDLTASQREQVILQTKVGIVRDNGTYFDFSYGHIMESVDQSLAALRTEYVDILLLHRPDALVEPEEVARAFDELQASGKVRAFGVSNHTPPQIELLRRFVTPPLIANQLQLSMVHASLIAQGIVANMEAVDAAVSRDLGMLDYCRLNNITIQAWSPFQAGFFTGPFVGNAEYAALNAVIDRLATQYAVPPIAIAVAWITRHPANMQVVIGTTSLERVLGSAMGSDVPLTRPEWYELFRAAGHLVP